MQREELTIATNQQSPRSDRDKRVAERSKAVTNYMNKQQAKSSEQEHAHPVSTRKKRSGVARFFIGLGKFILGILCICVMLGSVLAVVGTMYLVRATENDDETLNLTNVSLQYTTILYAPVYDTDGSIIEGEYQEYARLYDEANRIWVDSDNISQYLKDAIVAIEDQQFYTSIGFNLKRTVFAVVNELAQKVTGSYLTDVGKQGASTLEQQLVKNLTGDDESSGTEGYLRKFTEIFRAIVMDKNYSKEEILEAYLNTVSFTGNIGGVEAAANRYFNCSADEVTLAQAATIAAITNNPVKYSPITNPENNMARRNQILHNMLSQGYITQEQYNEAMEEPLRLYEATESEVETRTSSNSWFTDAVVEEVSTDLMDYYGCTQSEALAHLYNDGLRIYLTINTTLQSEMEAAMVEHKYYPTNIKTENYQKTNSRGEVILNPDGTEPEPITLYPESCMVSMDYDGGVVAMVGSMYVKEVDRGFNRVTDGSQQVGSTMKGVAAYPLAIEYDYINYSSQLPDKAYQVITNSDGSTREWPKNYEGAASGGNILAVDAIAQSKNTCAVWTGSYVTARTMFDFATEILQIDTLQMPDDVDLAPMVLGATTYGITPLKLCAAYMMYGSGGYYVNPHTYTTITQYDGTTVMDKEIARVQAISSDTAWIMNRLLRRVIEIGTARRLDIETTDAVGKTGTSNNGSRDKNIWWVGLTPYYCTAGWYGYDDPEVPIIGLSHSYGTQPIIRTWRDLMDSVQADYAEKDWPEHEDCVQARYCTITGDAPNEGCPTAVGWYKSGTTLSTCVGHGAGGVTIGASAAVG